MSWAFFFYKNVRYIAIENFIHPDKRTILAERFYHESFTDYDEFLEYFKNMKCHVRDGVNVTAEFVKEKFMIDISKYENISLKVRFNA